MIFLISKKYVYKSFCLADDSTLDIGNTFMMHSLFWTWSELLSYHIYDYDGYIFCTHSRITYWIIFTPFEKNSHSRIPLPYRSISVISPWNTLCPLYSKCLYFLPIQCPVFINLIFIILYHFSAWNYIDENRRFVDCILCILSIYTDLVIRHHLSPYDQQSKKTKISILSAFATPKIIPSQIQYTGCVQIT